MANNLQNELDKNRFFIIKNGLVLIIITTGLIYMSLSLLKIENLSILELVFEYYFR